MGAFIHQRGKGGGFLIASLSSEEADIGSHTYGFGHFFKVSCHVPAPPRTARVPVLREADDTSSVVQEKGRFCSQH